MDIKLYLTGRTQFVKIFSAVISNTIVSNQCRINPRLGYSLRPSENSTLKNGEVHFSRAKNDMLKLLYAHRYYDICHRDRPHIRRRLMSCYGVFFGEVPCRRYSDGHAIWRSWTHVSVANARGPDGL